MLFVGSLPSLTRFHSIWMYFCIRGDVILRLTMFSDNIFSMFANGNLYQLFCIMMHQLMRQAAFSFSSLLLPAVEANENWENTQKNGRVRIDVSRSTNRSHTEKNFRSGGFINEEASAFICDTGTSLEYFTTCRGQPVPISKSYQTIHI